MSANHEYGGGNGKRSRKRRQGGPRPAEAPRSPEVALCGHMFHGETFKTGTILWTLSAQYDDAHHLNAVATASIDVNDDDESPTLEMRARVGRDKTGSSLLASELYVVAILAMGRRIQVAVLDQQIAQSAWFRGDRTQALLVQVAPTAQGVADAFRDLWNLRCTHVLEHVLRESERLAPPQWQRGLKKKDIASEWCAEIVFDRRYGQGTVAHGELGLRLKGKALTAPESDLAAGFINTRVCAGLYEIRRMSEDASVVVLKWDGIAPDITLPGDAPAVAGPEHAMAESSTIA
jgi:hypothetical protein